MLGQPRGRTELSRKLYALLLCLAAASVGLGNAVPAGAQGRYPPFPIDGSTPSSPNPTRSGSASEFFNPGGSAGRNAIDGASSSSSGSSAAGGNASSDADAENCLLYVGQVGRAFVAGRVQERGLLRVGGQAGCARPFSRVDVSMESDRVRLGPVETNENGGYFAEFRVPSSIKAGSHHVIAEFEGSSRELRRPIQVLALDGASVLGTSTRNASGSSSAGSGVLPRTGADLMKVLMWALVLVAFGSLLIAGSRKLAFARAPVSGGRRNAIAALPLPEVPFVDTSRFVPYRSAAGERLVARSTPRSRPASWDSAPRNEQQR